MKTKPDEPTVPAPSSGAPNGESRKKCERDCSNCGGCNKADQCSAPPGGDQPRHSSRSRLAPKRRGELAEAAFLHKAASLGFSVAKPWGDSDRYDFILENGAHSWRVQVKSSFGDGKHGHTFHAFGHSQANVYTGKEIDFLIAYVVLDDIWYVFPVGVFAGVRMVKVRPFPKRHPNRYEKYREAWCLMACPKDGECRKEIDFADDCQRATSQGRCPKDP